ncbi:hypothetical protein MMC22_003489 [Lobaria immixta]|nr:hypothetical protein [Lobaria immixta]
MVATCSSPGDAGGTLHFPSPTHIRHVDAASAFKQLRRSLSRSPSKGPTFRLMTSKSASPSPSSPLSPSRAPPPNRSASANLVSGSTISQSSPLGIPFSGARSGPSARRLSPMRVASRSRSSQRSPGRPTLSDSSDNGNATPRSSSRSSEGIENKVNENARPGGEQNIGCVFKLHAADFHDSIVPQHRALAKLENGSLGPFGAKSSPLKRSDGIMNLDQANLGSPSAKRRSIHGSTFSSDFDIFDPEAGLPIHFDPRGTKDGSASEPSGGPEYTNAVSPLPRRTSTLRKTTLQQRHDKPSFPKSRFHADLALESTTPVPAAHKGRLRMSVDNFLPSTVRDSPFSSQGSLPNASAHPMSQQSNKPPNAGNQQVQRHPLSRAITQSSSNSSLAEDSPTHIPVRQPEHRRAVVDFSKSLPVGARRPDSRENASSNSSTQASSTEASFSTPENYKLAKPLPAAFMSTGLISKRHKDIEDPQPGFHGGRSLMPDTPCKRTSLMGTSPPAIAPDSAIGNPRQMRHSFGTPSTPFSPHSTRPAPETFGKGMSIFGSNFDGGSILRGTSFRGIDTDDHLQSPPTKYDSQSSTEFELPPTPTKQALTSNNARIVHGMGPLLQNVVQDDLDAPASTRRESRRLDQNSKSIPLPLQTPFGRADGNSDSTTDEPPSVALRFRSYSLVPSSFTRSRFLRNHRAPSPLWNTSCSSPSFQSIRSETKTSPLSPASPVSQRLEPRSPHTPRDSMAPPDPSGLSISAHGDGQLFRPVNEVANGAAIFPPATPTASREHFASIGNGRSSLNSSHNIPAADVDPSLKSKFDKVELIGTGEFSQVYRVTQAQESKATRSCFSHQSPHVSPRKPMPDRVWAVKKSRHPYLGLRDRQRRFQEVTALKELGHADHIINFFDSWEDKNHLYIQTEFCEEGSLDVFLSEVGQKARLDDFRIWKIMLELSLGLKHIHDSGFIHLDLKPANVFITFEGILKVGDFGMATQWPAQEGIEGEGDREYIGPEILKGQFDKPSDVFALGLIMLEIAGNVMLPDNGASWQRLRSGDMSDVPSLTWSSEASIILRDSSGKPLSQQESAEVFYVSDSGSDGFGSPNFLRRRREEQNQSALGSTQLRCGELADPPDFMVDATHEEALDNIVRWMISPGSADRPTVDQILGTTGVRWAEVRRRAGATVYEGNWGPADEVLTPDQEMIDV